MDSNYFYCHLTPSTSGIPYHYTKVLQITYADNPDLGNQQNVLETQYRSSLNNPDNYNASWSSGDTSDNTQAAKDADIQNVRNNGGQISDDPFPA